jgi:hypothetical protein
LSPWALKKQCSFKKLAKKLPSLPFSQRFQCACVVTGSDQVFNREIAKNDETYFLPRALFKTQKKYAYAASFGNIQSYLANQRAIDAYLNEFTMISLREENSCSLVGKKFHNVRNDLDPTLLFPSHFWSTYCVNEKKRKRPYILLYTVATPLHLKEFARNIAAQTNLDLIQIDGSIMQNKGIQNVRGVSPGGFLSFIQNAEYVCTTSFHGTAFSLIFKKKFFVEIGNGKLKNERIENLLSLLHLEQRNISEYADIFFDNPIDYHHVDTILERERASSIQYISEIVNQVEV